MTGQFGWLVSYPKSGNTWLRLMLSSLVTGGAAVDINSPSFAAHLGTFLEMDDLLGVEASDLLPEEIADARPMLHAALAGATDGLVLRKVHDRYWRTSAGIPAFNPDLTRGAVYLARDPRDIVVSYAHHRGEEVDTMIDFLSDANAELASISHRVKPQLPQPMGSWSAHVDSWLDQRDIPVLALRYEDLLRDPEILLGRVADHLGIAANPEAISSAVGHTRFEILQALEEAHGFTERQPESTDRFFRTGSSGGWRSVLSPAQAGRIERTHAGTMARLGYLPPS